MKSSRVIGLTVIVLIAFMLVAGTFSAGFLAGRYIQPSQGAPAVSKPINEVVGSLMGVIPAGQAAKTEVLFKPFWQTWNLVHDRYVEQPVDDVALMRGAIQGMLKALGDEHSSYLDPDMTKRFEQSLNGGDYEGIGAYIDITGEYLKIISPMPGTPAEKAGLKPGDLVIAVDGEDMTGVDGELVHKRIVGPEGTKVVLTILREGTPEPFDVEIIRAKINIPTIESKMLADNIAYIRLNTFGSDTTKEFEKALQGLLVNKPTGLILDLRFNGGGLLDTAVDIVSEFIPDGTVLYEEYSDGHRDTIVAHKGGLATGLPIVVLINGGSASASEIVAGAIQDRDRGLLVGEKSFGKGSVQILEKLVDDQGQVRLTIARWLTPSGRQINKLGLEPDYPVEITDADREAGRDPQLEKAIELLKK